MIFLPDIDFERAIGFINKYAPELDKIRFYTLYLDELSKTHKKSLLDTIHSRDESKLFTFEYEKSNPPSVISTTQFLFQFHDALFLLNERFHFRDIVNALLPYQLEDGSWSETDELLSWNFLPDWADTRNIDIKIWVSALATTTLSWLPSTYVPINFVRNGINYLNSQIDSELGSLKGLIISTFNAIPLFYSKMIGSRPILEKVHKKISEIIDETDIGGSIGWFAENISLVTNPKVRPIMVQIFRKIKELQLPDGTFTSEEGEDEISRAKATVQALVGYLRIEQRIKTFLPKKNIM